ncbi:MAG: hypothetical protein WCG75_03680, partial [Armatimonadota bacterium]
SIVSDRIVDGYGPVRFRKLPDGEISADGTLFATIHNKAKLIIAPDPKAPERPSIYSDVDCLQTTCFPLELLGLRPNDSIKQYQERATNPSNLSLFIDSSNKSLIGKGSDSIKNLLNRGFSKPILVPQLLGELWFSCNAVNCSELDFLSGVANIVDCKLTQSTSAYNFEPDIEKIRNRVLSAFRQFGTPSDDLDGLHQKVKYRAFEVASQEIIRESISNPKMYLVKPMPDDRELLSTCKALKAAAMDRFVKSKSSEVREFKEGAEILIVYGYSFGANILVEMKDGRKWLI